VQIEPSLVQIGLQINTRIKAPTQDDMVEIVHSISQRIAKYLEKVGLVERDMENSFLNLPVDDEVNPDG
jgi:hypothetical protein